MLRWACALHAALGGALLAPTIAGGGEPRDLASALAATERAIDALRTVEGDLLRGDRAAIARALSVTEAPLAPPQEADALLGRLRDDLARLFERASERASSTSAPAAPDERLATGIDAALRDALRQGTARARLEPDGYCADSVRTGIARFLAGDPKRAATLLEPHSADSRAAYWLARSHEANGDLAGARVLFERLAADTTSSEIAARARFDLDVLSFKAGRAGGESP